MTSVFIVWECDVWHSHNPKKLVGVFSSEDNAIEAVVDIVHPATETGRNLVRTQLRELFQTQGNDVCYEIERVPVDIIND